MKIPWRRARLPTPVLLPRESHGQRSLVGYSPYVLIESDTTRWLSRSMRNHEQPEALLLAMWVELTYWYKTVVFLSVLSESLGSLTLKLMVDLHFQASWWLMAPCHFLWMVSHERRCCISSGWRMQLLMWDPPELFPFSTARDNIWDGGYSISLNYSSVATQGIFVGFRWYDVCKI